MFVDWFQRRLHTQWQSVFRRQSGVKSRVSQHVAMKTRRAWPVFTNNFWKTTKTNTALITWSGLCFLRLTPSYVFQLWFWLNGCCHGSLWSTYKFVSTESMDLVSFQFSMFTWCSKDDNFPLFIYLCRHFDSCWRGVTKEFLEHCDNIVIGVIIVIPKNNVISRLPLTSPLFVRRWVWLDVWIGAYSCLIHFTCGPYKQCRGLKTLSVSIEFAWIRQLSEIFKGEICARSPFCCW